MKVSELIKILKKGGCHFVAHDTRHDEWYSPLTGKTTLLPRHPSREMANGTVNRILKDMGLK
ncbi:MAG: type II toxin-antitoxin system HicA family toxin [Lachnospiraceae bacterium]|nr:type II toxin-antitoxin system HicA family toxin [Lachnospiraceae bacterium]